MSYKVVFADSFTADLDHQIGYLLEAEVNIATVAAWVTRLRTTARSLSDMPERHAVDTLQTNAVERETRRIVFGEHLIFYQVDHNSKRVDVVALVHGARHRIVRTDDD